MFCYASYLFLRFYRFLLFVSDHLLPVTLLLVNDYDVR